ncbi:glycine--tRNA ligase subunit beta [Ferrimonas sediminicola]|uniref:Glycine--tRNA ligase beta subunit n=1 Tax=Ferrimonas sediminicola TaxID=2569538 RepID=A0A4U1B8X6_9GAMM|nr:glycine--tRNA ligase subunit beta [Ferrimonas sediminicola]TKB46986.1 glycine--tRNA ligase subunit beta [Ferrimonas sediminicola]
MATETFLVELGTEELPPKALRQLGEAFRDNLVELLAKAELPHGQVEWFASPRRLAVKIAEMTLSQADKVVEKRGPAVKAAFDADGNPTKAAEGWARSNGITVAEADRMVTDKGEWLLHKAEAKGQGADALLPQLVKEALSKLPIPKAMRWGSSETQFIRPVHTLTLLLGNTSLDAEILDVKSGLTLQGHRFMGQQTLTIADAEQYPALLEEQGKVIADYEARKAKIKADLTAAAAEIGGNPDMDDELLEEVTSLVEWPVVMMASFEEKFLNVPAEALVYTMKGDQKYFPLYDNDGKLMPRFLFVANVDSKDPRQVIEGNEKVVRPRLADAEFFFETDKKQQLVDQLPRLQNVLFQKQLGTLRDKTDRILALSEYIAGQIGANTEHAARAGLLCKCDLMTSMVFEFTDTQGIMGMHYARHDGEAEEVAVALNEQYMPRYSGDDLPASGVAQALALADKMDTLVGIFGIGQAPKGAADPFALRRAAIGALRIIVEKALPLDLADLIAKAQELFADRLTNDKVADDVLEFMLGRFRAWYQDEGYPVDVIQAVLALRPSRPLEFDRRVKAVQAFRQLDAAQALAAANKRVGNILAKSDVAIADHINEALMQEAAERALAAAIATTKGKVEPLFAQGNYGDALAILAGLRDTIDNFFEEVMVNAEDPALKANRLAMLKQLRGLFMQAADISLLQQ